MGDMVYVWATGEYTYREGLRSALNNGMKDNYTAMTSEEFFKVYDEKVNKMLGYEEL